MVFMSSRYSCRYGIHVCTSEIENRESINETQDRNIEVDNVTLFSTSCLKEALIGLAHTCLELELFSNYYRRGGCKENIRKNKFERKRNRKRPI